MKDAGVQGKRETKVKIICVFAKVLQATLQQLAFKGG